jgi:chemotaxis signal transduction protein
MTNAAENELETATFVVQPIQVGSMQLAIPKNEVLSIEPWREPTPLPSAPEAVLGIVCIQGRMLTLLDTAKLLNIDSSTSRSIVALRGKEQLALAIDGASEAFDVSAMDIELSSGSPQPLIRGIIRRGQERLHLLAREEFFDMAMRGYERRRRRF